MNKKEKRMNIKNIVLILIIVLIAVFLGNIPFVGAVAYDDLNAFLTANGGKGAAIGDILNIGYSSGGCINLIAKDNIDARKLYCVDYSTRVFSKNRKVAAEFKIEIRGSKAYSSHWVNGVQMITDSTANAKLAYILSGGDFAYGYGTDSETHTDRQIQLWSYWTEWLTASGNDLGMLSWADSANDQFDPVSSIDKAADEYVKQVVKAEIKSNVGEEIKTNIQNVGPFNVTYTGEISSIVVKDTNGNQITNGISFSQNNRTVNAKDVVSGEEFYIINNSGKVLNDVTVKVFSSKEIINLDMWCLEDGKQQNVILVNLLEPTIETTTDEVTIKLKYDDKFEIVIDKQNISKQRLPGAEFKVQVLNGNNPIGWLYYDISTEEYNYVDYKYSTTWSSSVSENKGNRVYAKDFEQGIIRINGLNKNYRYKIYEVTQATGYATLDKQIDYGMEVYVGNNKNNNIKYFENIEGNKAIDCGTVSYDENNPSIRYTVFNVKKPSGGTPTPTPPNVQISGIVWDDGYNKSYDNKYYSGERVLSGITVYLKRSSDGTTVKTTTTNSSGKYTFNIATNSLSDYYIEIAYTGIGSTYRIVEPGTGNNASKAKYQDSGRAWTDSIDSANSLSMNIGLRELPKNTQSVDKWIDNIKMVMKINGQTNEYTYKYGQNNTGVGGATNVGVGSESFYRTIYASDIAYSIQDGVTDGLEVYITYKIKVTNETSTYQSASPENKRELDMTATVVDNYDKNYYTLSDSNWSGNNGSATYKSTLTLKRKGLSNNSKELSIKFKLTDKALKEILEKGSFTAGNKVKISGTHNYQLYEIVDWKPIYGYRWVGEGENRRRRRYIKRYDPIYGWVNHSQSYSEENFAPGMTFSIHEYNDEGVQERTIKGTVFEDKNTKTNGEVIGDGIFNQTSSTSENLIKNVKVELLDTRNSNNVARLYRYEYNEDGTIKVDGSGNRIIKHEDKSDPNKLGIPAVVCTDQKGNYEFKGIVPSEYIIRFTYGDGRQYIYNSNGNQISDVKSYDYKSTIITETNIKKILKGTSSTKYWYRENTIKNGEYSIAVDNLDTRKVINGNSSNKNRDQLQITPISATSPKLKITLENESATSGNNANKVYIIDNMNFGIIDTPKISLGFEKTMTNIKVTNTQGNVIIDANPGKIDQNIKYLNNLDSNTNHLVRGSDYAKIEINDEEIYGSKLEITYAITLINNSDINYYENNSSSSYGYYYKFGETSGANEVNITIDKVYDYLIDNKLNLSGHSHELIEKDDSGNKYLSIEDNITTSKTTWKKIFSGKKNNNVMDGTEGRPTYDTATLVLTRTLSEKETDMMFDNKAEVKEIHVTNYPALVENVNVHFTENNGVKYTNYFNYKHTDSGVTLENPSVQTSLTIVPPTGADMMTVMIYIVTAIVSGIIITTGIILIKKKVLDK